MRALHSLYFEGALIAFTTPMIAYAMGVGILEATVMGTGFSLFALAFAFLYNWDFDYLRVILVGPYPLNSPEMQILEHE